MTSSVWAWAAGMGFAVSVATAGAAGLQLTSPAFQNNGSIPSKYTCDGAGTMIAVGEAAVLRHPDEPGSSNCVDAGLMAG